MNVHVCLNCSYSALKTKQTIENWINVKIPDIPRSGYYCYDEQHITLKGKNSSD